MLLFSIVQGPRPMCALNNRGGVFVSIVYRGVQGGSVGLWQRRRRIDCLLV